ncbi:MAG: monofunctional biosynthetic peptidoglycan transglycosylase [Candidatus Kapabacteria bacterium]|nr:monofunctional biosynthetic peptidoglycan transglycosylase [Candidatus Kapabacteria bacterium]
MSEKKTKSWPRRIFKWAANTFLVLFVGSIVAVVLYKFIPVPITPLMVIRTIEGAIDGRGVGIDKDWVSYDEISPHFFRAVISAEDARFLRHGGIDWRAVDAAKKYNEAHKGKRLHGASTITMQTAKNTFLWNGRNYIRKGLEVYFTYLIEAVWGKKRILEVYANIVEMGDGVYGVEAASQKYFGKPAKNLTKIQAARIAAVLPNPRRWSPAKPTRYIQRRVRFISGRQNSIALPKD